MAIVKRVNKSQLKLLHMHQSSLETVASHVMSVNINSLCEISGFRREVHENSARLGYYSASSGIFLQTLWDNLSVPSSRVILVPKRR
jgi:hypothetical protein